MTTEDYKAAGYSVSGQVSQQKIDHAEKEVTEAYIAKVAPSFDSTDADVKAAVMQLAVILLLNRHAVATRSGGKTKESPQLSQNTYASQGDVENADRLLRKVQTAAGLPSKLVDDIAGIYYRTQFVGL
jgi:hypothetical protein